MCNTLIFLENVDDSNRDFVERLNNYLMRNGCNCNINSSDGGYLVSYEIAKTKATLIAFAYRKHGAKLRIFGEASGIFR